MTSQRASRRRTLKIAAGAAAAVAVARAAEAATPDVVGVWKLAGGSTTDPSGKPLGVPYGPRGMGLVSLTADGRMMAVLVDGRARLPDGAKREYSSYCGNYTFDGSTLITTVDAASDPARMGSRQVRKVRFEGERMILVPPEREEGGVKLHRELAWERISAVPL
ncbi:MAG: lipocalin-like domain-containing protein [Reyranella sp.]|uniref:lipocalin-like domain-containing protein n=1 Tax=Reyranella sp. TaxID=1929291 RepID=UPI001AD17E06|nr:lipocalin-like domain-containing protein [Reyranella sp.]MBN9090662.1 lipocalin-like domain-containing protein [Reyranella sp.]